jgi:two-component system, cell cycle sensor histidine kinase and response regulator CckA
VNNAAGESHGRAHVGGSPAPTLWGDTVLRRLVFFVLAVALPLIGLVLAGFLARFRSDRDHAATLLQISQQTSTQLIANYLRNVRYQLTVMEQMPEVRMRDEAGMHQIFRQYLRLHPEFINLVLMERTGVLSLSEAFPLTRPPQDYSGMPSIAAVLGAKDFTVSLAAFDSPRGHWGCVALLPLSDPQGPLLAAPFNLHKLSRYLFLAPDVKNIAVTVLDQNGTVVLSSVDPETRIGLRHPANTQVRVALASGLTSGEYTGLFGEHRAYSAGLIPGAGWLVVVSVPTEDIYHDAYHNLWRSLGYIGAILLASVVFVIAYARSITRPIAALAGAARAHTAGSTGELAPVAGPLEVRETAQAFNLMVEGRRQAELASGESERRHRELFQSNPQPMYVYDLTTLRILDVNQAALTHYGYTREEFLRLTLEDIRPREDIPQLQEYVAQLRGSEAQTMTVVVRHRKKNGEIIVVEVSSNPLQQAGAHARLVLAKDITEQTRTAQALEESERRYRTVIDQTGQIVYEVNLLSGAIQWYGSEAVPAITGCTLEEFRQVDLPRLNARFHPDDLPRCLAFFERQQQLGGPYHLEYRLRHQDGSYRLIEDAGVFLHDAAGRAHRSLGRMSDITDRRRMESALRQVIDLVPHYIYARDAAGRYVLANEASARIYGLTPAEMLGRTVHELTKDPGSVEHFTATDRQVLETGQPLRILEEKVSTPAGVVQYLNTVKIPFQMPGMSAPAVLGVSVDITDLKHAEAARQELEKKFQETQKLESLGVMAGGIAHDFNNLLTGILGNAGLAKGELPPGHAGGAYLDHIEKASLRAADLCKQMLAYSGKGRFQVQRLDLNELIEDTVKLLRLSLSKKAGLRLELTRPLAAVKADSTQLRQVLMNLVINASEALADRAGTITLATGPVQADRAYLHATQFGDELEPGDYVFLEVTDDGCGMDRETLARIFDPFFTTKFTGRGLGLAAVLGIVRGHRGAIRVDSRPGAGTTFRILLPAVPGGSEAMATPAAAAPQWRGRGRVLIVDDEDAVRQVTAAALRRLGFTPEQAVDGQEGVEKFRQDPAAYVLVILDLTMPRMDGVEAHRQMRALRPDLKAVLMSGFNRHDAVDRFTGQGLSGFVQKPFELETLVAELRRVLETGSA